MKRKPRVTRKQAQLQKWSRELAGAIRANRDKLGPHVVLWRHAEGKVSLVPKDVAMARWREFREEPPFGQDSMPPGAIGAVICTESGARWAIITVEEIAQACGESSAQAAS